MSQNVVNFDFQGVVGLFIHEISGDWSQIMSKLKSAPQVLILIENTNIFAIYDYYMVCDWSHNLRDRSQSVTGTPGLYPFVHISTFLAVTGPILTKLFEPSFLETLIF